MAQQRQAGEVRRKVYFYRLDAGREPSGKERIVDVRKILKAVNELAFQDGHRYIDNGDGNITCGWADSQGAQPTMRLATIRKTELPQYESNGALGDLELPDGAGLAEAIHILFFGDNVLGAEFNFHGPRASRIPWYFKEAASAACGHLVGINQLMRYDLFEQLSRFDSIKKIVLKATPTYAGTLDREGGRTLAAMLAAASEIDHADQVSLSIAVAPRSHGGLGSGLLPFLKRLVKKKQIPSELVSKFEVTGFNPALEQTDTIDLLGDALMSEEAMLRVDPRNRVLQAESVYAAIRDSHAKLKGDIATAIQIG